MKSAGKVMEPAAREMVTRESSRGWRRTSRVAAEFGEFVEEEDAVVGDADFAGGGNDAAADEADVGDGVVGGAEGARGDEAVRGVEQEAADAVDLGGFDGFLQGHRRDDGRDALGEHRFAGAGRADEQDVVIAGDGDLDGPLDVLLAADIGEIDVVALVAGEELGDVLPRGGERALAGALR
jgi:hypothetical protein